MNRLHGKSKSVLGRLVWALVIAVGFASLLGGVGCDEYGYYDDYGYGYDGWLPDTQTILDATAYQQATYDYTNSLWSDYFAS